MTKEEAETKHYKKLLEQERSRTAVEKYAYRRLGGWWYVIPSLMMVGLLLYIFAIVLFKVSLNWTAFLILVIGEIVILPIMSINEDWDKRRVAKRELEQNFVYRDGYNYTDSAVERGVYTTAKVASYLLGVAGYGALSLLAFSWLGSITIAPTTIIIILLVVIILNQERNRN